MFLCFLLLNAQQNWNQYTKFKRKLGRIVIFSNHYCANITFCLLIRKLSGINEDSQLIPFKSQTDPSEIATQSSLKRSTSLSSISSSVTFYYKLN